MKKEKNKLNKIEDEDNINYRHEDMDINVVRVDGDVSLKEATKRKNMPVFSGVLKYFPLALLEISKVSLAGNEQHHKGEPLHWDRSKSTDELDALARHLIDAGKFDTDGMRHSAKVCWRALANLEKELENDK